MEKIVEIEPKCLSCKFCKIQSLDDEAIVDLYKMNDTSADFSHESSCHKNAPLVNTESMNKKGLSNKIFKAIWPNVNPKKDWCGEFEYRAGFEHGQLRVKN